MSYLVELVIFGSHGSADYVMATKEASDYRQAMKIGDQMIRDEFVREGEGFVRISEFEDGVWTVVNKIAGEPF